MARKPPHEFKPKFINRYLVLSDDTAVIIMGSSRREVLGKFNTGTYNRLVSCGGRTATYDTDYGIVSITRMGRGVRIPT